MKDAPLYLVKESEDLAANQEHFGIIAAGPWIKGSGEVPHRVVIRLLENEFVVHNQTVESGVIIGPTASFHWGWYGPKFRDERQQGFEKALRVFVDRIRVQSGLSNIESNAD